LANRRRDNNDALVKAMRFTAETLQNQRMRLREVALLARCSHPAIIGVGHTRFRHSDGTIWCVRCASAVWLC
jgi:hypothetical protein